MIQKGGRIISKPLTSRVALPVGFCLAPSSASPGRSRSGQPDGNRVSVRRISSGRKRVSLSPLDSGVRVQSS